MRKDIKDVKIEVRTFATTLGSPRKWYEVWIVSGCQSFRLDYKDRSKRDCQWFAKMLRIALGLEDYEG
jgi:hypothetical protein